MVTSPPSVRAAIRNVALKPRIAIDTVSGGTLYVITITGIACWGICFPKPNVRSS